MCLFPPLKHLDGDPPVVVAKSPPLPISPLSWSPEPGVSCHCRVHTGNWPSVTQLCVCNSFGVFLAFLGDVSFLSFIMWCSFPSCVSSIEIFTLCLQIISSELLLFWRGLVARLHLWLFVQLFKDFSKGKTLWKTHLQLNFNGASPRLTPRFYSPTAGIHIQWLLDLRPFPNTLLVEFMRRRIAKQ